MEEATSVSYSELMNAEISRHKSESSLNLHEDPLKWWRLYHHSFPHLANAVQKFLAIVATLNYFRKALQYCWQYNNR